MKHFCFDIFSSTFIRFRLCSGFSKYDLNINLILSAAVLFLFKSISSIFFKVKKRFSEHCKQKLQLLTVNITFEDV
jgi:hypothetical protein